MSAESTNPTPQYAELCQRLRATSVVQRGDPITVTLEDGTTIQGTTGDITTIRNPDGPEAATALQSLHAENERLREALEPFAGIHDNPDRPDSDCLAITRDISKAEDDWREERGMSRLGPGAKQIHSMDGITLGHIRTARAALSPDNAGGGNG